MGDLGAPQGGRDGLEGMCLECTGSQAVKPKSEIHWAPEAFGNQALQPWGGTEPGWGTGPWGVQAPWSPRPTPYSAE